jgi:hypothetical protein
MNNNIYDRIVKLYNNNSDNELSPKQSGSMWNDIIVPKYCNDLLVYLKTNNIESIKYILENISQTDITYGYDVLHIGGGGCPSVVYIALKKLLNEMNILPIYLENNTLDIEAILPLIDSKCGFRVEFPEIFDYSAHSSIVCSRGKISGRMVYALYYVWNISMNVENISEASVLEIGAGTARTAYYAFKFGFKKYTIVDIISTQIVQAHYNLNLLGEDKVSLYGEDNYNNCFLNLCPSDKFNYLNETYDIICNFDGLTEYGINIATNYLNKSMLLTKKFLSINHTTNYYSFTDLYSKNKNIKILLNEKCDYRPDEKYYKEIIEF